MKEYPDKQEASIIWQEGINYRKSLGVFGHEEEYIFHTQGVAKAAAIIAEKCDMDTDKAYVFGLLHDYGKHIDERKTGKFHGLEGYRELLKMNYPAVAKICLTHCFPEQKFNYNNYPAYNIKDLQECRKILATVSYDDYDLLIQFCDMLFEKFSIVTAEDRIKAISLRYNVPFDKTKHLYDNAVYLKTYFDTKCGCDVYGLLGISNVKDS